MSLIPMEGANTFYTMDGFNSLYLNVLNPFGVFANWAITIDYPTFPTFAESVGDEPDFLLKDFLGWCYPLSPYFNEGEDSVFYGLFILLRDIAKLRVRWTLIQEKPIWKRLIALYIGHYMEININAMKDEANRLSTSPYIKEKDYHLEYTVGNEVYDEMKATIYGKQFWFEYVPYTRLGVWGTPSISEE